MIEVRRDSSKRWRWYAYGVGDATLWSGHTYDEAEHALRDAWTWAGGNVPALVFT